VILVAAMASIFALAAVASQAQVAADAGARTPPAEKEPLRLETFADRLAVKRGESIDVKVWVASKLIESGTVTVHFAQDQLVLEGAPSRPLPKGLLLSFIFRAKSTGKSNILVRVEGTHKDTKETITASQHIEGIEVQGGAQWWSPLFSSSLFGVVIGALLAFLTTWLNERRQRRGEERQRQQWIIANLPAQLEFDRAAALDGRETNFASWRGKLLTEGYYADLARLTGQEADPKGIAQALIRAGFRLQD